MSIRLPFINIFILIMLIQQVLHYIIAKLQQHKSVQRNFSIALLILHVYVAGILRNPSFCKMLRQFANCLVFQAVCKMPRHFAPT